MPIRGHYMQQLDELGARLRTLGQVVVAAVTKATEALNQQDIEAAQSVITGDQYIDRDQRLLEQDVIHIMATQQPVASDLRLLIATIEIASELERIGDYARGIAKIVIRDSDRPALQFPVGIKLMAEHVVTMLIDVLEAFTAHDSTMARRLGKVDDRVDALTAEVQDELIELLQNDPSHARQIAHLFFVVHNLERTADRATNIAERIIFFVSGENTELNS